MGRRLVQIGDVSGWFGSSSSSSSPLIVTNAEQLETVRPGDLIAPLNDYLMEWDEDCLPPSKLEPWRHEGDPLCDAIVRALHLRPGQDGLQTLLDHLALPSTEQTECVRMFWDQISGLPPDPINAIADATTSSSSALSSATPKAALARPSYRPDATLSEGQAVFWRYSAQIFSALLHFSLAGGFSAERVVNVLRETSYLTGEDRERTYRRLLETTQAIMDYMTDMTPLTGIGWKSAIRVRMLHASVRVRLLDKRGVRNVYDEKVDGVPINQEDLLATLGSFAIAPLWSLRRIGVKLSEDEEAAYVAVWRHIGFYLGISPSRLAFYYTSPRSISRASKLFACMTMHLFSFDLGLVDYKATETYRLLSAVANRPPRPTPVEYHLATSRLLLGDGLADRLALPPTSRKIAWRLRRARWIEWALIAFGRVYVTRWEVERVACTRLLVAMLVCWQLGVRRTKFTIKSFGDVVPPTVVEVEVEGAETRPEGDDEAPPEKHRGDEGPVGKRPLDPDDDELDPEVTMGPEAGRRIIARWRWLLAEMAGVVVVAMAVPVVGVMLLRRT